MWYSLPNIDIDLCEHQIILILNIVGRPSLHPQTPVFDFLWWALWCGWETNWLDVGGKLKRSVENDKCHIKILLRIFVVGMNYNSAVSNSSLHHTHQPGIVLARMNLICFPSNNNHQRNRIIHYQLSWILYLLFKFSSTVSCCYDDSLGKYGPWANVMVVIL